MALTGPYTTKEIIKARLNIPGADTTRDAAIAQSVAAASEMITNWCGQPFGKSDEDEVRYFTSYGYDVLDLGPVVSITALATDRGDGLYGVAWEGSDFFLAPRNAALNGKPYTRVWRSGTGHLSFPLHADGVRVTGIFGWPAVPAAVAEATAIQASRLWKRTESPMGLQGQGEFAVEIPRLDPDVQAIVAGYRVEAY